QSPSSRKSVVIIVPVYRGVDITRRCIESVLKADFPKWSRLLLINDFSPDSGMKALLDSYGSRERVTVLHNPENYGFVRTVNSGMKWSGCDDVVLLNSDTEVAGDWLERLADHVAQVAFGDFVASVTATSNNATICSFPSMEGQPHWPGNWPAGTATAQMQRIFSRCNRGRSIEIPTAVGFCMYITRKALTTVGYFDEEAFGKGYGEENDFCMRAAHAGFKNLQALDCAVYHEGEVSFGQSSHPGKARAAGIIKERYPSYDGLVGLHAAKDCGRAFRLRAQLQVMAAGGKEVWLVVTHIHGGGVERAVADFLKVGANKSEFLVLQRASQKGFYRIKSANPTWGIDFEFSARFAPEVYTAFKSAAKVKRLVVHHVMDLDNWMLNLLLTTDLPHDMHIHDYWTICPQITLTTKEGRYCGEPDTQTCNTCISQRHLRTHAPLAAGLPRDITKWRTIYEWLVLGADKVIVPSRDVKDRLKKYFPKAPFAVIYHENQEKLKQVVPFARPLGKNEPMRVGVLGSIGVHKGLYIISAVQELIERTGLAIVVYIIGEADPLVQINKNVIQTGPYQQQNLQKILDENLIHLIWFPEGAPETYSYTLSHAMAHGYPVVAPKIGAFPERVAGRKLTWLTESGVGASRVVELFGEYRKQVGG
ncbi:MAG: glycosyltransferase, partial [Proteobacteria bacterium]|nr:glycosyltransferase [Pseudomonadota bacterium]